ncbi:MAG TPA: hypothetical protein EYH45_01260 [Candidatus Caldiarchaeum subterraneum]|uniref:Uncharacterized protein n=1 Tax=Caldiarchaeum subterraneum TaxID=311458 RepID=A0A832ZUN9_CALS0|nr:hypothetical protein [Candidatus Caldarchaeum subterraneum]
MRRQRVKEYTEALLDILLSSVNPERVDDDLGWKIAENIKDGRLFTHHVRSLLHKAVILCEPDKLRRINRES